MSFISFRKRKIMLPNFTCEKCMNHFISWQISTSRRFKIFQRIFSQTYARVLSACSFQVRFIDYMQLSWTINQVIEVQMAMPPISQLSCSPVLKIQYPDDVHLLTSYYGNNIFFKSYNDINVLYILFVIMLYVCCLIQNVCYNTIILIV